MVVELIAYKAVTSLVGLFRGFVYCIATLFTGQVEKKLGSVFKASGIRIVKSKKEMQAGDIVIHKKEFYPRVAAYKILGLGESYVDGVWDCDDLEEHFYKLLTGSTLKLLSRPHDRLINYLLYEMFNLQTAPRSWEVGKKHYDIGNDLFVAMLDKNMNYSCGYWKDAQDLDQAQINKMELIAKKLMLKPGMKVLDIGCGWGALSKYLAEHYKVKVVGLTISAEQAKLAEKRCKGFDVEIRLQDYRDLNETFDRVVSVGMFEHVGRANYRTYFEVAHKSLKEGGIFLLHTIGVNTPLIAQSSAFINTYIFPNGILPRHTQITTETDGLFIIEDWQNMGYHYSKTLQAWMKKFQQSWPDLKKDFPEPERFYRMWNIYLAMSSAGFRSRKLQLWQVVLSKDGVPYGYDSPR